MAIYHLETQVISRSDGRSAVACAAYRSGDVLLDERTRVPHRHGDPARVAHTEIVAPAGAPAWALDREQLWNRVEAGERRKDSQLAREWEVALPVELTLDQQIELLRGWVAEQVTLKGVVADISIHDERVPDKPANPHAHIMGTLRALNVDGWGTKYERAIHRTVLMEGWRSSWAEHTNRALARAGHQIEISHLSHADRNLDVLPTVKEGWAARAIEAQGGESFLMAENRRIRAFNKKVHERLRKIKDRLMRSFSKGPATVATAPQQLPAAAGPPNVQAARQAAHARTPDPGVEMHGPLPSKAAKEVWAPDILRETVQARTPAVDVEMHGPLTSKAAKAPAKAVKTVSPKDLLDPAEQTLKPRADPVTPQAPVPPPEEEEEGVSAGLAKAFNARTGKGPGR